MRGKPTEPKNDTGGYILTGVIVTALCVGAIWAASHPSPPRDHPIGFGPEWTCAGGGSSIKGMGFCMRNGPRDPPLRPPSPPEIPKLSAAPEPPPDR